MTGQFAWLLGLSCITITNLLFSPGLGPADQWWPTMMGCLAVTVIPEWTGRQTA